MKESRNLFLSASLAVALAIILSASAATPAHAQTYTVLYNFSESQRGPILPFYGPIAQGRDGNLYATTSSGGVRHTGTAFRITPTGTLTVLSNLGGNAGHEPFAGLTLGQDGNFYGTTSGGGSGGFGTLFQVTPEGKLTVLYSFSNDMNGAFPYAAPIQGADGAFYGTARGVHTNPGTVYKITSPQHLAMLHQFTGGADGGYPKAPLLQATDGNFYGTTQSGTAFKITPAGVFTRLGRLPGISDAPLVETSSGNFYGTTSRGGASDEGTVFQLSRTGSINVLHDFSDWNDGANPHAGLVHASDGNFYGATSSGGWNGGGTIYRISPTGDFAMLYMFGMWTGFSSETTLFQHTNGILYGETFDGGASLDGVFYSFDVGAPPFIRLVSTFGKIGQTIGILGQGLTETTDVSFNGIPATYTVSSDTYLEATVPAGATTGVVTVTTSTGTLTSNQPIQVRQ